MFVINRFLNYLNLFCFLQLNLIQDFFFHFCLCYLLLVFECNFLAPQIILKTSDFRFHHFQLLIQRFDFKLKVISLFTFFLQITIQRYTICVRNLHFKVNYTSRVIRNPSHLVALVTF